ncbi:MAG: hypothetical protein QM765_52855 [Myxococcales bacterium]
MARGVPDEARRAALVERERALLKAHAWSWLPEGFLRTSDALACVRFHRGLLASAALASQSLPIQGRAALEQSPGLEALTLLDVATDWDVYRARAASPAQVGAGLAKLDSLGLLSGLRRLAVRAWGFDDAQLEVVSSLQGLRLASLSVRAPLPPGAVTARGAGLIAKAERLRGLRGLELVGQPIEDAGAEAIAKSGLGLEKVELLSCELTNPGVVAVLEAYDPARTHVDLRGARLDLEGVRTLAAHAPRAGENELSVATSAGQVLRVESSALAGRGPVCQITFGSRAVESGHLLLEKAKDGVWWAEAVGGGVRLGGRLRVTRQRIRDGDEYYLAPDAIVRCTLARAADSDEGELE